MTLQALNEAERHELIHWLEALEETAWDKQIEKDFAPNGRGLPFLEQIKREITEGKARPMKEGFTERGVSLE